MKKTAKASPELTSALKSLLPDGSATTAKRKAIPLTPEEQAYKEKNERMEALIQPLRSAVYEVDMQWHRFEEYIEDFASDYGGLQLNPDFQRGHVWTPEQQQHFLENVLRGVITSSGFHIQFNCPNWDNSSYEGDLPRGLQCVDGLQRLTAVSEFMKGNVKPFGMSRSDFEGCRFDFKRNLYRWRVGVHNFERKADLLAHYLALNAGGTPHSPEEIARVRAMQEAAAGAAKPSGPSLG